MWVPPLPPNAITGRLTVRRLMMIHDGERSGRGPSVKPASQPWLQRKPRHWLFIGCNLKVFHILLFLKRYSSSFSFLLSRSSSSTFSSINTNACAHEFSVRKLLKNVITIYPVKMQPPVGSGFTTTLRHYKKQGLAFMVNTERMTNQGGWFCDKVGMGKVCIY